jgi:hypothetical protein
MKHDWEPIYGKTPAETYQMGTRRRCRNCHVEQYEEREYVWMRLVSVKWRPLVGRCKGAQENAAA